MHKRTTVELGRDNSCSRDLVWRLEVTPPIEANEIAAMCDRLGLEGGQPNQLVQNWNWAEGDRLVYVPRTSRVQLRLNYLLTLDEREAHAGQLRASVESAIRSVRAGRGAGETSR